MVLRFLAALASDHTKAYIQNRSGGREKDVDDDDDDVFSFFAIEPDVYSDISASASSSLSMTMTFLVALRLGRTGEAIGDGSR